jgi:hypothetical protein
MIKKNNNNNNKAHDDGLGALGFYIYFFESVFLNFIFFA